MTDETGDKLAGGGRGPTFEQATIAPLTAIIALIPALAVHLSMEGEL